MKKILLFLGIICSVLGVYADENVLQTIEIEPVKDTYNIVLIADKAVDAKKTVQAPNKINIDLKGIRASKTLNTVYNNVSNVDTVMVEPHGNGISIYFQAENAQAASISFDSIMPITTTKNGNKTQKLKLNNPIESYAPIYDESQENTKKTSNLFNKLTSNDTFNDIKESMDENNSSDFFNKLFSFGLVALLVFSVAKLLRKKEPEMQIGLSQQFAGANESMPFANMQPAYSNSLAKPFTTVNYGLNAYKNENKNPYESNQVTFHNPNLRNYANRQSVEQIHAYQPANDTETKSVITKPLAKKMTTPANTTPVNQSNPNIDNLKFLESMTAIYEKSGRHDLAKGLLESLNKNNIV